MVTLVLLRHAPRAHLAEVCVSGVNCRHYLIRATMVRVMLVS